MTEVVEHLPSKSESPSSITRTAERERGETEREREREDCKTAGCLPLWLESPELRQGLIKQH
jgi:hypothetical protein